MTGRFAAPLRRLALREENRRWWTLGAMCFALFMIMLDNTVVNVALPSIQRDLGASLAALAWTINAYTLTFAVLLVTAGRLGDIFGRRRMFLFGVVVFALSSATIGLAPSTGALVASRALQGVGAAFMMPATLSIVSGAFPPHERGRALGTWAGVSALALAIGPVVGGLLTESVSWRAIFFLNLPVAAAAVAVTLFAARESRDETVPRRIDVPGMAALTAGLGALVLALVEGNAWGWGSARVLGLLGGALVSLVAFVAIERRTAVPMIDFAFFRSRTFLGASLVAFSVSFAMLAMFFFLALYMQNVLGYSPLEAGVRFLPSTLVVIVMGPVAGRLTDRIGPRPLLVTGLVIVAGAMAWQSRIEVDTSYAYLAPAFVAMGLGISLVMSPMSTAALNAVHPTKAGVASGVLSMSRMLGGTFGVAVLGALVSVVGQARLTQLLPMLGQQRRAALAAELGAGGAGQSPSLAPALREAFVSAVGSGLALAGAVALVGAAIAWVLISGGAWRPASGAPAAPAVEAAGATDAGERAAGELERTPARA